MTDKSIDIIVESLKDIRRDIRAMHGDLRALDQICLTRKKELRKIIDDCVCKQDSKSFKVKMIIFTALLSIFTSTTTGVILIYVR